MARMDWHESTLAAYERAQDEGEARMARAEGEADDRLDEAFADELGGVVADAAGDVALLLLAAERGNHAPLLKWLDAQRARIRERMVSDIYEVAA